MIENISYSYMIINGRSFSRRVIRDCDFSNTILNNCDFSGSRLINCNFNGAELNNCNFENAKIRDCEFAYAIHRIKRHRIVFAKVNDCNFRNTVILYTDFWIKGNGIDFSGARIGRCNFLASNLENVNFTSCRIKYLYAEDTCFKNSDLIHSTLEESEFEKCDFGLNPENFNISYQNNSMKVS